MFSRPVSRWLGGLLCCLWIGSSARAEQKQVLILLQTSGTTAAELLLDGAKAHLRGASDDIELFVERYDADRFGGPEQEQAMAAFLRSKYRSASIDLVIAAGPAALGLMVRQGEALFPSVPLEFAAVRDTNPLLPRLPPNATGIVSHFDVTETLELALALQPKTQRVVFISGESPLDAGWREVVRTQFRAYADRLEADYLRGMPLDRVLTEVSRLPRDTIVVFLTMQQDRDGVRYVRMNDMLNRIAAASNVPVYGVYETYVGRGVVGGYVDPFEPMGAAAGALALRMLSGEDPGSIPPERTPGEYIVDSRQLRRWHLDTSDLPPGTIVRFANPSVWSRYRLQILGVFALVALQTLAIVALWLRARNRRVEQELRETEDRYRNVVETQTDLICRYLPDTTLTFVNEQYCRYFGRSREELIGRRFTELIPEDSREKVLEHVRSLVGKPRTETYEHQVVAANGSAAWQQWVDHVIVDRRHRIVEIQGIGRDITRQRLAESEARQRHDQVVHLTRVAILGELSGALAHELRQPLTAILTNAQAAQQLLARGNIDVAEFDDILADIVADGGRAGMVITRLRSLLKRGSTDLQPLNLNGLMREVLMLARSQILEHHVVVAEQFAPELPEVLGDKVQLQQVLLNLLMNACEALSANPANDRRIAVATVVRDDSVKVAVVDNGPGLPSEAGDLLFEPFFTTKEKGLGLGLSISRSIIRAHGGHMSAKNDSFRGTIVDFTLPIQDVPPISAKADASEFPNERRSSEPTVP